MKQVLIVDDAATVRLYHREMLEGTGFAVTEAVNGVEALEQTAAHQFDLLVVDVNMPQMDGYSLLQRLRREGTHMAVPVMMVTTEAEAGDRRQSFAAGANLHLTKPIDGARFLTHAHILSGAGES